MLSALGDETPDWPHPRTSDDARVITFNGAAKHIVWRNLNDNDTYVEDKPTPTAYSAGKVGACYVTKTLVNPQNISKVCADENGVISVPANGTPTLLLAADA
jgi:hypothetical protein